MEQAKPRVGPAGNSSADETPICYRHEQEVDLRGLYRKWVNGLGYQRDTDIPAELYKGISAKLEAL